MMNSMRASPTPEHGMRESPNASRGSAALSMMSVLGFARPFRSVRSIVNGSRPA
jgi:hypothetical protein